MPPSALDTQEDQRGGAAEVKPPTVAKAVRELCGVPWRRQRSPFLGFLLLNSLDLFVLLLVEAQHVTTDHLKKRKSAPMSIASVFDVGIAPPHSSHTFKTLNSLLHKVITFVL